MNTERREQDFSEPVVGIDIGDRVVTAARVQVQKDGQLVLTHAGMQEYAANATDARIAHAIRALWRSAGLSCYTVASCLRSQLVCLKHFRLHGIRDPEMESALKIEAEEALQMPQDRIAMDWHVTRSHASAHPADEAAEFEGLLVAAPAADVQRHLSILRMAGLYPVVLDVGALAVSNLYHAVRRGQPGKSGVCLVSLGHRVADIAVLYDSSSVYPRTIFSRAADWDAAPDFLATNIQDVLKYYQFKLRQQPLDKIMLCGHIPVRPDFIPRLETGTGMRVEVWNPANAMKHGFRTSRLLAHDGEQRIGPALAASIGLALRRD